MTGTVENGDRTVDAVLLEPIAVTQDNVESTVLEDGFWSEEQVCTDRYRRACETAGIR